MNDDKALTSLSLDLDNKWSYMKTHGDPGWESFPSYLDLLIPRVLDFLATRHLTITFFVVGQDAALDRHRDLLATLAPHGHEVGNHSFHHEPWLHRYTDTELECELSMAEEHIQRGTGQRPIGFRGPGFSVSAALLKSLARRGYLYDASTFPTFLGPVARLYYFATARLTREQSAQRKALFGKFREGMRPIRPYQWKVEPGTLLEIPVTTMPFLRVPVHFSYLIYLSTVSPELAVSYFRTTLRLCRMANVQPSFLLHPLDFLGCDDVQGLSFFPGMQLPGERKLQLLDRLLGLLVERYRPVTLREHALASRRSAIPLPERRFS